MSSLKNHLKDKLSEREKENSLRQLILHDKNLIDFYSNDYLGLARKSKSFIPENAEWGSTGSRLLGGNSEIHESFEKYLADYHKSEAALLFNSGYAANTGLFSCLLAKGDTYIYDELCHASIRDGIRLNHATAWSFLHNDLEDLEKKLKSAKGRVVVIVESVYSMDGHFAPLKEMVELTQKYNADLIVDEAHAVGIFGDKGEGRVIEESLQEKVFARVITFGKAIGAHGAAALGSADLRNYLINFSRPFIYTTALPPVAIQHLKHAYAAMENAGEERNKLRELIIYYRKLINERQGLQSNSLESHSPIQSILIAGNDRVKATSNHLTSNNFDVRPILSPTVPLGKERLRISLHSFNSEKEISDLLSYRF